MWASAILFSGRSPSYLDEYHMLNCLRMHTWTSLYMISCKWPFLAALLYTSLQALCQAPGDARHQKFPLTVIVTWLCITWKVIWIDPQKGKQPFLCPNCLVSVHQCYGCKEEGSSNLHCLFGADTVARYLIHNLSLAPNIQLHPTAPPGGGGGGAKFKFLEEGSRANYLRAEANGMSSLHAFERDAYLLGRRWRLTCSERTPYSQAWQK